jgi:hypothetical protein
MQRDSSRRRFPLADRVIEVIDDTLTGEVLLDEALKMMKSSEKMSVSSWIDLMSGKYRGIILSFNPVMAAVEARFSKSKGKKLNKNINS